MLDELSQTYPSDFDAAYLRVAETDTARVLQAFADERDTASSYVRATIDDATPLFQHLDRADAQE
jgi:predicted outer membrane protein